MTNAQTVLAMVSVDCYGGPLNRKYHFNSEATVGCAVITQVRRSTVPVTSH